MIGKLKQLSRFKAEKESKICLVTDSFEEGRGGYMLNSNLIKVFESIFNGKERVLVISSNCRYLSKLMFLRVARVMIIELENTFRLIKISKNCHIFFFTFGSSRFLPMLAAKVLNKRIIYMVSGLAGGELRIVGGLLYEQTLFGFGGTIFSSILSGLETVNYHLADVIAVESPFLSRQIVPNKHLAGTVLNGALYVDTEAFYPKIRLSLRADVVSYFGTLTKHKGVMNFIEAIPQILEQRARAKFSIGGGPTSALPMIQKRLKELLGNYDSNVVLTGMVGHAQMPDYLNKAMLVILPSYGEGLPNIILEAMACGTPVLATQCGGIPDLIRDGETGFIMEDNSPQYIAKDVIRSLSHPNLEEIALNARLLVEREYTQKSAKSRYIEIFKKAIDGHR